MTRSVAVLAGDGVGPEVTAAATAVLRAVLGARVEFREMAFGGEAIDATGEPLPAATLEACLVSNAVLLGAVGGPKWDHLRGAQRCEAGLLRLRRELGVFSNLRPVRVHPSLSHRSALRAEIVEGVDLVVVRELTGGIYFGEPKRRDGDTAVDTCTYTVAEVERVAHVAFKLAGERRGKVTSVDKANVMVTSQLWRETVTRVGLEYPAVALEHQLVDSCAMRLVQSPRDFDVVLTENLFGDILSDEAGVLSGSLGMLPSASVGDGGPGLFEPIHGSAPDIAGTGVANPLGAILSAALMLRMSLGEPAGAAAVEAAVDSVVTSGVLTPDLGGSARTGDVAAAVLGQLRVGAER
ncbi:MAG: 3-isopropylmalate dehydrogenase [Candidatus Dormibacteria bacterium]